MEFHKAANIFPLLSGDELKALSEDIKENGQRVPVEVYGGKIIDGRNRWIACEAVGVECEYWVLDKDMVKDPVQHVLSLNLHRRHLNESQRAMVAAKVQEQYAKGAKDRMGSPDKFVIAEKGTSRDKAGEALGVSGVTVGTASAVLKNGSSKLVQAVESGILPVSRAKAIIDATDGDKAQQTEAAKRVVSGDKPSAVYRDIVHENRPNIAPPKGTYSVIYADPPWEYGDERGTTAAGGASATYPTMPLEDICELDIKSIAAKDSVLFLWATVPLLVEAMDVIKAWGFKYKTHYVWDKVTPFYGNYSQVQHEVLMLATRGSFVPTGKPLPRSVITEKKERKHSSKPESFYRMIETMYPATARIELFARAERKGWKKWGNE